MGIITAGEVDPKEFKKIAQIVASNMQTAYKQYDWVITISGLSALIKAKTENGIIEIELWAAKGFALMYTKVKLGKKVLTGAPMPFSLDVEFTIQRIASDVTAWIKQELNKEIRKFGV